MCPGPVYPLLPFPSTDHALDYASQFYGDTQKIEEIRAHLFISTQMFAKITEQSFNVLETKLQLGFSVQFYRECLAEIARLRNIYF